MIRYTLCCTSDHRFESWFPSAAGFEALRAAGHLACPICGSTGVTKALMAPSVAHGEARDALTRPQGKLEEAMAAMRRHVEENSDYVGLNFVAEARKMHEGDVPERSIYGEAKLEEAQALLEDGVPVAPLPFMPARKVN
jgi:hypothetical protein